MVFECEEMNPRLTNTLIMVIPPYLATKGNTFHPVLQPTGFQFLYNTSFEDGWGWMVGGCPSVAVTEQQR